MAAGTVDRVRAHVSLRAPHPWGSVPAYATQLAAEHLLTPPLHGGCRGNRLGYPQTAGWWTAGASLVL